MRGGWPKAQNPKVITSEGGRTQVTDGQASAPWLARPVIDSDFVRLADGLNEPLDSIRRPPPVSAGLHSLLTGELPDLD